MNLKISLPKGLRAENVDFSLPFDITVEGKLIDGHFTANNEKITLYVDNKAAESFDVSDFDAFETCQQVGSAMIRAKRKSDGKWHCFCAFTQKYFLRYAEVATILDYYVKTGDYVTDDGAEEPTCKKCGASLENGTACPFCTKKTGTLKKMISRLKPYRIPFIWSIFFVALTYINDIIAPIFQRTIIDDIVTPQTQDYNYFGAISVCLISLAIAATIARYISRKLCIKIAAAYSRDLRRDLFNKTQQLSMKSISKHTPGELIKRIDGDVGTVQDFITQYGKDMVIELLALIALTAVMFFTNWKLALIVIIPLPIAFFAEKFLTREIMVRDGRWWRKVCQMSMLLHDILSGVRVVKSYGSEQREINRFTDSSQQIAKAQKNIDCLWYIISPVLRYIISLGEFAMLYVGASMVLGSEIKLGELVQFTNYVYLLYGPLQWLINLPRCFTTAAVAAGKVFEVLEEKTEISDTENAISDDIGGNIEFSDVNFGYKTYSPVLKNINCEIKQGEMIGIVGHSGVGKSTFINLLMRLYDTTSGSIKIDGKDIKSFTSEALHKQVGVVLQETFLFNGTVLENIAYAKPEATFEEIISAAKIANCHDFIVKLPDGYNTLVGEKGYNLSGGERQRVAIARAILHDPKILILDEATASLDTETEKQIQDALGKLIKGRTVIAIAHRLSTLSSADRLIVLDKGTIAEMGTHRELMEQKGVYYGLVMAQRQTARIKKTAVQA